MGGAYCTRGSRSVQGADGIGNAEQIFRPRSDDQLIDERIAFAIYLSPLTLAVDLAPQSPNADLLAGRCPIGPDHSILVARSMKLAVRSQHGDRYFQNDGIDVESSN